jgi:PAS domain S-box-containing protein
VRDLEGRYLLANRQYQQVIGLTSEQAIGRHPEDLHRPQAAARIARGDRLVLESGKPFESEDTVLVDNEPHTFIATKVPLRDATGRPNALCTLATDITDRVRAEETLRRYTDRLEILRHIDQGILAAHSPEAIAQAALKHIRQLLPCQRAAVMLFDFAANEGVVLAVDARGGTDLAQGTRVSLERVDQAVQTLSQGTIAVIGELAPRGNVLERLRAEGARSFVCVPLMFRGQLIGSLNLAVGDPDAFTQEYEAIAQQVADQLTIAIQQARLHEQVQSHADDLERRVAGRTRELAVLYEVATMASQSLDLEATLSRALERVLSAIGNDEGTIHLLDEADGTSGEEVLCLSVQRGVHPDIVARITSLPPDQDPWGWVIAHDEPLVVPDVASDPLTGILSGMAPCSYVGVPMRAGGQVVGVLSTFGQVGRPQLTLEELSLLTSIADEMGVCVESARLRGLAQEAAVLEERTRLARELHDSVTQLLYSINLFAKSGRNAYRLGDADELDHCLAELGETAQQAFKEMRLLVYELRPPILEQEGLVGALQRRLDAVEGRADVITQLLTSERVECPRAVEKELYHIASEALNNALKHAAASSVSVRIDVDGERLELEVVDDGKGFALQDVEGKGGLGIVGMRERAAKLGGILTVISAPGQGTTVGVAVPCTGRET